MEARGFLLTLSASFFLAIVCSEPVKDEACCEEYCYYADTEHPQNGHFNSLTAYDYVRGSDLERESKVANCSAKKIWMIVRHGTRMPRPFSIKRLQKLEETRDQIVANYEKFHTQPKKGALCDGDLKLIKGWKFDRKLSSDSSNNLTPSGWEELKRLAIRFKDAFPEIIGSFYDPEKYAFRSNPTPRMYKSFEAFVTGLFGLFSPQYISASANDSVLHPYDSCPLWKNSNDALRKLDAEPWRFLIDYTNLIEEVSRRLGFTELLEPEKIEDMFDMCSYDTAFYHGNASAWCSAFTQEHVKQFEYHWDLLYYMGAGYRLDVNTRIMGTAVADMLELLESKETPALMAYFGRSNTLKTLMTSLGIARSEVPLRADNYADMGDRQWRVSQFWPFACNFAAIKYECAAGEDKVMFFLNERRFAFENCENGFCNLSDLKEKYKHFLGVENQRIVDRICARAAEDISARVFTIFKILGFALGIMLL